ncbi:MAG: VWA containing CoxE family protein, partial [Oscillospiraceae bacterium]|nr:VWA containing CoxE family protein [Oscillospiraceae bacterium]
NPSGMEYFRMFKKKFPHIVWLNPAERQGWFRSGYWGRTYDIIANEFDMYTLTVENLEKALKKLMVNK